MNTFKIYIGGRKDKDGNYVGETLDSTFTTEVAAMRRYREIQWDSSLSHETRLGTYLLREGDERFMIEPHGNYFSITDKATKRYSYGLCLSYEEAVKNKEWVEKYHWEGWYY